MNYKSYAYSVKRESIPIGDVEERNVVPDVLGSFWVFENGEVATTNSVGTGDLIKGAGPFIMCVTWTFADGSMIIIKSQGTVGGTTAELTSTHKKNREKNTAGVKSKIFMIRRSGTIRTNTGA